MNRIIDLLVNIGAPSSDFGVRIEDVDGINRVYPVVVAEDGTLKIVRPVSMDDTK